MSENTENRITLTRTVDAPAEELFAAWTDPALLEQWQAEKVSFEPFEGGSLRFETADADTPGAVHIVSGSVLVYEPDSKLVERWAHQGEGDEIEESILTVIFKQLDAGRTEITLTEEAEAHKDPESRIFSIEAWDEAIGELAELLE